jgi:hypothetical protein
MTPWNPLPVRTWPYGPGRPPAATAAGVLGIAVGGLTTLAWPVVLDAMLTGGGDATILLVLVLGVPIAAGLIAGGVRLLRGRPRGLLLGSALATVALLLLVLLVGAALYPEGEAILALAAWVVVALPLPVVTVILTAQRSVAGWTASKRPR